VVAPPLSLVRWWAAQVRHPVRVVGQSVPGDGIHGLGGVRRKQLQERIETLFALGLRLNWIAAWSRGSII
jgi:hypothetical protein